MKKQLTEYAIYSLFIYISAKCAITLLYSSPSSACGRSAKAAIAGVGTAGFPNP